MIEFIHCDPLVMKAYRFAKKQHGSQTRRYSGVPYISHPVKVATLLMFFFDDPVVIAAALLHDVTEDTNANYSTLLIEFGEEVAQLVSEVSDVSTKFDGNRKARKALDNHHLSNGSPFGQSIKLADIFHNLHDVIKNDPKFAKTYFYEKKLTWDVLVKGHPLLRLMVKALIDDFYLTENAQDYFDPGPEPETVPRGT